MPIARLAGKRKMSQNRSDADRAGVATGLAESALASERAVAPLVRPLILPVALFADAPLAILRPGARRNSARPPRSFEAPIARHQLGTSTRSASGSTTSSPS